jgi:hypothetical protein
MCYNVTEFQKFNVKQKNASYSISLPGIAVTRTGQTECEWLLGAGE